MDSPDVQEMLDEYALRKLVHGYCRAVDRGDLATLRGLYHPDADDSHGSFSTGSVEEFVRTLAATRPHIRSMQHHITTTNFAIDGDVAEGEVYSIATHTFAAKSGETEVVVGGRYLDRYEKRHGTWKFTARCIVTDWAHVHDPSAVDESHPITRDTPHGSPGPDDPSHEFFALL
ncbi:nuclear transport factor 2 family protein [Candidatus Mycobacterium wuenschmannii]|uniref:Nuclear transport factor 2 family protein n=1 Tax=Candidatus Mycobacterium wuenschmannii TaxID=3027808 RepID=A0ABY8W191_9MYCO|nr:nuclear transport factor 2 family protein [Candidatus Mycobacterium wuenschmannii]WIM88178.1 nuclear transport factor 2 family protein [Candidatus Mycobacterium wuenschmannii]